MALTPSFKPPQFNDAPLEVLDGPGKEPLKKFYTNQTVAEDDNKLYALEPVAFWFTIDEGGRKTKRRLMLTRIDFPGRDMAEAILQVTYGRNMTLEINYDAHHRYGVLARR